MRRGFQQIIMIEERKQKVINLKQCMKYMHAMQIRTFLATNDKRVQKKGQA